LHTSENLLKTELLAMESNSELDAATLKSRAQLFKDIFVRLENILRIHCTGDLMILSPQFDEVYVRLRQTTENLLAGPGFEELLKEYPVELIPKTLHSLSEEPDILLESGLREALDRFTGEIIEFCINIGSEYGEYGILKELLKPYDDSIKNFDEYKRKKEKEFFSQIENDAKKFNQQVNENGTKTLYVDIQRKKQLQAIKSDKFDLSKVIRLCDELNECYSNECYFAAALLIRAIVDHVPPIFNCKTFAEVASSYPGSKSFKESMINLNNSLRKIADAHLHVQIRKSEILPTKNQVGFSPDLDVLLGEIIRILK
jgi:hypothetical protein